MSRHNDARVYVGNLPMDMRERDIEKLFEKFGRISHVSLKALQRPPAFAFVDFEDIRDAEDAVYGRNGQTYEGQVLRVELSRRRDDRDSRDSYRDRDYRGGRDSFRGPPMLRHTDNRVVVTGLSSAVSWQDLKDHLRSAGEVVFADINRDGTGVVEFARSEEMKTAIEKFDDSEFRARHGDPSTIRVKEDVDGKYRAEQSRGDSDFSSRGRDRSRSRSPRRSSRSPPRR